MTTVQQYLDSGRLETRGCHREVATELRVTSMRSTLLFLEITRPEGKKNKKMGGEGRCDVLTVCNERRCKRSRCWRETSWALSDYEDKKAAALSHDQRLKGKGLDDWTNSRMIDEIRHVSSITARLHFMSSPRNSTQTSPLPGAPALEMPLAAGGNISILTPAKCTLARSCFGSALWGPESVVFRRSAAMGSSFGLGD